MEEKKRVRKSLLILSGIAAAAIILSFLLFIERSRHNVVIEESVVCRSCRIEKAVPFKINKKGKLSVKITAHVESGVFTFKIISAGNAVLFSCTGQNINETATLEPDKGLWYWQVQLNNAGEKDAQNAEYSVWGKIL